MPSPVHYARERVYPLPVAEAWGILADTEHLNRNIGLPAVAYGAPGAEAPGFVRRARARMLGLVPTRWREYPFDWVRGRRYTVRREFETGPVSRLIAGLEIEPAGAPEGGATLVRVLAELTPRHGAARPLLPLIGWRGINRTLAYCDRCLVERGDPAAPPRPVPRAPRRIDRAALDRALATLARERVAADLVPRLRTLLLRGSDDQVVRVRPYALARSWDADPRDVLRLFLHATRVGLFDLRWELMCPSCRVPKGEAESLRALPGTFHCETCQIDYGVDFERRVELRFTVAPAFRLAADETFCIGSPLRSPHILAQQYLGPGEQRSVAVPFDEPLALRAVGTPHRLELGDDAGVRGAPPGLAARFTEAGWERRDVAPIPTDASAPETAPARGDLQIDLENATAAPLLAVVEGRGDDALAATAAEVTLLQEFRDLFGAEVLAPGHEVGIETIALLFTDLEGSTALYEGTGDAPAYGQVRRHFDFLRTHVTAADGAIIKTIGDAVMAAFRRPEDAFAAALEIQAGIATWCAAEGIEPRLALKTGVHAGPAIAVTANERLDYFGRTVNLAARIQRQAGGGEIVLLERLWNEAAIQALAAGRGITLTPFRAALHGITEPAALIRLRLPG
ncbi:MAG: DUF5939 domain-containing protein [Gemmatimonadota bacterium]